MKALKINHLAVWILTVVSQVVSLGWYTLFSSQWMTLMNKSLKDFEAAASPIPYIVSLLTSLVFNYLLAWLFKALHIESLFSGLGVAALCWLGFLFLPLLTQDLFSLQSPQLSLINGGNYFVSFALAGLVLGAWRKYERI